MTYDQWKCDPGYDEPPEEDCVHDEYEADWNGRATCDRCGHMWWMSSEEVAADRANSAAYDAYCRAEERREWVRGWVNRLAFWRRWRKPRPALIDDEIPF